MTEPWRWRSDDVKVGDAVQITSGGRMDKGETLVIAERDGPVLVMEDGRVLTIYEVAPT